MGSMFSSTPIPPPSSWGGMKVVPQPYDPTEDYVLWNGEILGYPKGSAPSGLEKLAAPPATLLPPGNAEFQGQSEGALILRLGSNAWEKMQPTFGYGPGPTAASPQGYTGTVTPGEMLQVVKGLIVAVVAASSAVVAQVHAQQASIPTGALTK